MNRLLSSDIAYQLLKKITKSSLATVYDHKKHRLIILNDNKDEIIYFRLPIIIPSPENLNNKNTTINYVLLLIQSGNCAIGYFEDGVNLDHKVFRSYMVRKKQGKSQIKYLKTKGKSRAGSRVRLGETVEFFENINERLQDYFENYEIDRIAISCSKTLIPYLFNSTIKTPFAKGDSRLLKIPKHVHTPIYDVLLETNKFLMKGELIYEETHQHLIDELLNETDSDLSD
jgi:hypothetical protein